MGSGRKCGVVLIVPAADAAHTKLPKIMSAKSGNALATVLVAAAIVAALYFGREVLLPMALAVLLSFVLAPPVKLLQRAVKGSGVMSVFGPKQT